VTNAKDLNFSDDEEGDDDEWNQAKQTSPSMNNATSSNPGGFAA